MDLNSWPSGRIGQHCSFAQRILSQFFLVHVGKSVINTLPISSRRKYRYVVLPESEPVSIPRGICNLTVYNQLDNYFQEGDLILGAIVQVNEFSTSGLPSFTLPLIELKCSRPSFNYIRHLLAFVFAIEEINRNPHILPNITLGFQIYDSCSMVLTAIDSYMRIQSGRNNPIINYNCNKHRSLAALIGHPISSSAKAIAVLNNIFRYPQVGYVALDQDLSDKFLFPYFYRTVPSERSQYAAIIHLLQFFGWTWVGIITSEEDSNQRASEELRRLLRSRGTCVEYLLILGTNFYSLEKDFNVINKTSSSVIILYINLSHFLVMAYDDKWNSLSTKVFVITSSLNVFTITYFDWSMFNGSLIFSMHNGNIPGLKEFLQTANPSQYPTNTLLSSLWLNTFQCLPSNMTEWQYLWCSGGESLKDLDAAIYDVNNFRVTYSIYTAVYAVAHALHDMLRMGESTDASALMKDFQQWKLNPYIQKVKFKTTSGEDIYFDENGDGPPKLDILNLFIAHNKSAYKIQVGEFMSSPSQGTQLRINESNIRWGLHHSKTPPSVCSESCLPGYRKAIQDGRPACCYDCVSCAEGEISNHTDMDNCIQCLEFEWSNEKRDKCIPRTIEFLSYEDPFGAALALISLVWVLITSVVLGIFVKHQNTPIVKANNRDLSYALLIALTLSFLCSLLFIGQPQNLTCLFRQAAFGIIFAAALSTILAKTITVVIVFNATRPGSRLWGWVGPGISISLILVCTLGEVLICTVWLLLSPPFPDHDTKTNIGKIILLCNEGSIVAFYCVIGYIGLLAVLSFFVAFLVRKLPDSFNEAQHITFSMLVFCSVWVSFIPSYLSTKGQYVTAVEIFAILCSSAGLLCCIFIPKCYVILLKPAQNTKEQLMNKHKT